MQLSFFDFEKVEVEEGTPMKVCGCCKKSLPATEEFFTRNRQNTVKDTIYFRNLCRKCDSYHANLRKKLRKENLKDMSSHCDCCGVEFTDTLKAQMDHSYVTNKIRGWLCGNCNSGLGKFGDTVEGLEKAIAYLRRTNG